MNITLVISSLSCGGAERVLSIMANHWAEAGHRVTVLTFDSGKFASYSISKSIHWQALNISCHSNSWMEGLLNNLKRIYILRKFILHSKPDCVISFISSTNILVLLATRLLSCKVVISERNYPKYSKVNRSLWYWMRRALYPFAAHLVVQTDEIKHYFRRYNKSVQVIHNPVQVTYKNLNEEPEIELPSGKRLVAMGRMVLQKGFDLLIPVFANLHKKFNDWSLIIIGSGSLETELKQEAIRLGIEEFVYFPGRLTNPFSVLSRCDLFVLSSRYEGFPNALLEAMVCGLPPVSFDCPSGPGEIIKHGVNGFLIPPGDVKALKETLHVLMRDEGLRSNIGKEAITVRDRFAVDKIMKQWSKLIC